MTRHRTLALVALAYFLVVMAIPARAGQLPDIRGLSFVDPFQGVKFFAGTVPGFGNITYPLIDPTAPAAFNPTIPSHFRCDCRPGRAERSLPHPDRHATYH